MGEGRRRVDRRGSTVGSVGLVGADSITGAILAVSGRLGGGFLSVILREGVSSRVLLSVRGVGVGGVPDLSR